SLTSATQQETVKGNTSTSASNASATYGDTSVTLNASVTSSAGTVSQGSVTFTVKQGSTVIGTAASGNVTSGAVSVSYTLPAGTSAGTYTIQADYSGGTIFNSSSDTAHTFTVNQKTVTPSITAANKVYDRTTAATITSRSLLGVVGLDDVSL